MKILAFESTARVCSVAVCEDDRVLAAAHADAGLTHSEILLPMASAVLDAAHLTPDAIDLFACATGPGSFTGVRIGVATVKGLAFGRDVPCVGVSSLEALAQNLVGLGGLFVPCLDARRGQVYCAIFRDAEGVPVRICEDRVMAIDDLLEELSALDEPIRFCGDGYQAVCRAARERSMRFVDTPPLLIPQNAVGCALVAHRRAKAGEVTSDTAIAPVYLRRPQAERERLARMGDAES